MQWTILLAASAAVAFGAGVDFDKEIAPVLEKSCLECHGERKGAGGVRLHTKDAALKDGWNGKVLLPGAAAKSALYTTLEIAKGQPHAMPPDGQLPAAQRDAIKRWIDEGANWPAGRTLQAPGPSMKEADVVSRLHDRIAKSPQPAASAMKPYKMTIPGTTVEFEMVPIPGGEFVMGTPDSEKGHRKDEGPQHKVKIEPFWMEKFEVTWDEYRLFNFSKLSGEVPGADPVVDGISRPTRPYVEMSFGMGINGYPAISMTQHAANKYAEWLSAKTGQFYRLPTEAEWEYACRAGTTTAYSWGDDPSKASDYAVYGANSGNHYAKTGSKKPNPWGLYDMHGNVMEWTLDQYSPATYAKPPADFVHSTEPYPHSTRGGGWSDDVAKLRCGAREPSDPSWKAQDPQLPKSIWYLTDAQWLGFRLVRPLRVPGAKEMQAAWNNGVEVE